MGEEEKKTKKKMVKKETAKKTETKKKTTHKTGNTIKKQVKSEVPKKIEDKVKKPVMEVKKVEPIEIEKVKEKTPVVKKKKSNKLTTREKLLIGLAVVTILVSSAMYYSMFGNKYYSFKASWGIDMPNVLTEIYSVKGKEDEFGDYNTYHIYKYEEDEDVKDFVKWTRINRETVQYDTYEETAEEWLNVLSIDQKNRPSYEGVSYYYGYDDKSNEVVIIKNNKEKKIYLLEYFMKDE